MTMNTDIGASRIIPARKIPSARQGSPQSVRLVSMRKEFCTIRKPASVRHEARFYAANKPASVGQKTRIGAILIPHPRGTMSAFVR